MVAHQIPVTGIMSRFLRPGKLISRSPELDSQPPQSGVFPQKWEQWVPYRCFIMESPAACRAPQSNRKGGSFYDPRADKNVHAVFGRITVRFCGYVNSTSKSVAGAEVHRTRSTPASSREHTAKRMASAYCPSIGIPPGPADAVTCDGSSSMARRPRGVALFSWLPLR